MEKEECIFCEIANGKIKVEKIYENEDFFAFYDANPIGEGHTLIIPKKHFDSLMDLDKDISLGYIPVIREVADILMKKYNAAGFNILLNNGKVAGQIIGHVHFHLLPRKKGNNNKGFLFF
ncbi:MAG: HIT domain-containing protein [Nanoarchaeota archaeon]